MKKILLAIVTIALFTGCATQIVEKPSKVTPPTVPFSQFKKVLLVKSTIASDYAAHEANKKAARKIDVELSKRLTPLFKNFTSVEANELSNITSQAKNERDILVIKPYIKQIKFIGGAARFFAGAMAGSSVVVMDVKFEDAKSKKILSNPGYLRKAGAYSDAFGTASNRMLDDVAQDVSVYVQVNLK